MIKAILNLVKTNNKSSIFFVGFNVFNSVFGFLKSFIIMKYLGMEDLGILTLISATMSLFTLLQLGFLNGGYRIFSENHQQKWIVNDIIFSYFIAINFFIITTICVFYFAGKMDLKETFFAFIASFFGILLVFNNWFRNMLISENRVLEVNKLNIVSSIISMIFLFTVPFFGLYGALMVTFSVELVFFVLTILRNKQFIPKQFNFNMKQYKWILSYGFLPFVAGILVTLNNQVETWSINYFSSTRSLGEFYLVTLYIRLFLLIPTSVTQLFYPRVIKEYACNNYNNVKNELKKYFIINLIVCALISALTILLIEVVVEAFIPKHIIGIQYIWIVMPGIIIYVLLQPLELIFYAANKLKAFLISSVVGLAVTSIGLWLFGFFGNLTLAHVSLVKSLFYFSTPLVLVIVYMAIRNKIWVKT